MDKVVNTSTELGEVSDTNVPEQNVHSVSETEMQQNQSDSNEFSHAEEAHIGTEPNIPDDSISKQEMNKQFQMMFSTMNNMQTLYKVPIQIIRTVQVTWEMKLKR